MDCVFRALDVATDLMTFFHIKQVYGYLSRMRHAKLWFLVLQTDFSIIPISDRDWNMTVYGNVKDILPIDAPPPLEKMIF